MLHVFHKYFPLVKLNSESFFFFYNKILLRENLICMEDFTIHLSKFIKPLIEILPFYVFEISIRIIEIAL